MRGFDGFGGFDFKAEQGKSRSPKKPKHLKAIIIIAAILLVGVSLIFSAYSYFVEYWQIKEIGENFLQVFWKNIFYQTGTKAAGLVIFFAILFINFMFLKKNTQKFIKNIPFADKKWAYAVLSFVLAYYLAGAFSGELYKKVLLALNSTSFNIKDPVFSQDIGYYVFLRPLFVSVIGGFKTAFLMITVLCAAIYFFLLVKNTGRSVKDMFKEEKGAVIHVAVNLLIFFAFIIFSYKFSAENILYSSFGKDSIFGAGFIETRVWLIYYSVAPFALIASVIFTAVFLYKRKYILSVAAAIALPVIFIVTSAVSVGVDEVFVSPNERNMQKQYINNNIEATKNAFNLNEVSEIEYEVATNLTASDIESESAAIENIRVTDFGATLKAYNQLQYLRRYYSFNDVDIVPYNINGNLTAVSVAAREMNKDNIDDSAKSYANEVFRYTHGFGAVVSPINRVTPEGQPEFMVKDIPPVSSGELPEITEPRIYYGELTDDYVIVGPNNKELDYSEGIENYENSYNGKGGDNLSLFKRIMYAAYFKDFKMLVSGNIDSESKILLNRNIMTRVKTAVPFLMYDSDPYMIIDDEGRLKWAIDAYTYSSQYPYAQPCDDINYIRNSVKVIVDAYDGDLEFYQVDKNDPIINAYRKIYPDVFEEGNIPDTIKNHIRVPEYMFKVQTEVYQKYHIEGAEQFYDKDDVWQAADEKYENDDVLVEAYFTVAEFDGEKDLVLVQPFVLEGRHNMVGLLMMRSSNEHYGELVLYRMPKNRTIYGPMQVENKIDNDPDISREMTLWSSGGSSVIRGNLIVVPFKNSLIYVEPVYITTENNASLPELKRVVVAYNNEVVMEETIEAALAKVFSKGYSEKAEETIAPNEENLTPTDEVLEATDAVERAIAAYEGFKSANAENNFKDAGKYLDELDKSMEELKQER